jgi:hypothetical protein
MYSVPDMKNIDAFTTTQKIRTFLTWNIEYPELSKNQNAEKAWVTPSNSFFFSF